LRETYRFEPGQHLTRAALVEGSDLRRSYSILQWENDDSIFIAAQGAGGVVPPAARAGQTGLSIPVMPPQGRFLRQTHRPAGTHYLVSQEAVASRRSFDTQIGTGARSRQPASTLIYGHRSQKSTMFKEEIEDLKIAT